MKPVALALVLCLVLTLDRGAAHAEEGPPSGSFVGVIKQYLIDDSGQNLDRSQSARADRVLAVIRSGCDESLLSGALHEWFSDPATRTHRPQDMRMENINASIPDYLAMFDSGLCAARFFSAMRPYSNKLAEFLISHRRWTEGKADTMDLESIAMLLGNFPLFEMVVAERQTLIRERVLEPKLNVYYLGAGAPATVVSMALANDDPRYLQTLMEWNLLTAFSSGDIALLQKNLQALNAYPYQVTGSWNRETVMGIAALERWHGRVVTGYPRPEVLGYLQLEMKAGIGQ